MRSAVYERLKNLGIKGNGSVVGDQQNCFTDAVGSLRPSHQ